MVFIVKDIEKISIEGVNVLNFREIVKDVNQSLVDRVLAKFNLNGIEGTFLM